MSNTTSLLSHIQALNAATLAWVAESPTTRWACTISEDLDMWAKNGITTPAEFDHYGLVSNVYEATREVWGYKPSWAGLMAMSDDELRADLDRLSEAAVDMRAEQEAHDAWLADYEAHEQSLRIEGEPMFIEGCWKA